MSLIDDALKKTQSALTEKPKPVNPSTDSFSHDKIEIPRPFINPKINAAIIDRKKRPYFSEERKDLMIAILKNRYFISIIIILILGSLIAFTHDNVHQIAKRYTSFYSQFFTDLTAKPAKQIKVMKPAASVIPANTLSTLSLDGTLETGQARAALINNTLYHTGETVDGYVIKRIEYSQVILLDPNTHQTHTLKTTLHQ